MKTMIQFLVALFVVSCCYAQVPFPGSCPVVETQPNFQAHKYVGRWYEAQRYFAAFELGGKCVVAIYEENENGTISVRNEQIGITGKKSHISGYAFSSDPDDKAKLSVVFPSLPFQIAAPYWVLGTDYTSYSVVWSCASFGVFHTKNLWILTRDQNPAPAAMEDAMAVIERNNLSKTFLTHTNQKNCDEE